MSARRFALIVAVIAVLALFAFVIVDATTVAASDVSGPSIVQAQAQDEPAAADDDTRLSVQLWTVLAAGGAAGVALVFFVVRVVLGRVSQPPPQEDGGEH